MLLQPERVENSVGWIQDGVGWIQDGVNSDDTDEDVFCVLAYMYDIVDDFAENNVDVGILSNCDVLYKLTYADGDVGVSVLFHVSETSCMGSFVIWVI